MLLRVIGQPTARPRERVLGTESISDHFRTQLRGTRCLPRTTRHAASEYKPVIRDLVAMTRREVSQLGVWRVALVGDVRRKRTTLVRQETLTSHPGHVLSDLAGTQVVSANLFRPVCVIEDSQIELHLAT